VAGGRALRAARQEGALVSRHVSLVCLSSIAMLIARGSIARSINSYVSNGPPNIRQGVNVFYLLIRVWFSFLFCVIGRLLLSRK
jgi:hypothetical protein